MAAIGSIRKQSTLLLIFVGVALLAFILGDFVKRRDRNQDLREKFISVGKEYVSHDKFMDLLNNYKEQAKDRAERNLTSDEEFQINEQLYSMIVDSMLIAMQGNCLGITVTNEELYDLVAGPQPHREAARFFGYGTEKGGMQLAQYFIENMDQIDSVSRANYMMLEAFIEKEAYTTKYLNLLSKAYYMPKAFTKKMQEESLWKADLEIVQIPYSSSLLVSDDKVSVNEDDLKKWYNANKYRFKQEQEVRTVEYVIFNVVPSEADLQEIENNVAEMYDEFTKTDDPKSFVNRLVDTRFDSTFHKAGQLPLAMDTLFRIPVGSFIAPYIDENMWTFAKLLATEMRPDSVNISFIVVTNEGMQENVRRKKEESKAILDSAYHAVMSGANFYEVAARYSDYPITQMPDSGRIWLIDGVAPYLFGSDIFDTIHTFHAGTIIKREIIGGTLIVKLNEKTDAERKIQVAIAKKAILPSDETIENIESAANTFANGLDGYKQFNDAVIKYNLDKRSFDRVERMTYALPGTNGGNVREVIHWIYDEKTKKGDVSQYSLDDMYVVVVLKDILKEGYQTLDNEQVREYVEVMAKRDKKAEMMEEILRKSLSENNSIAKIAEKHQAMFETSTITFADRNLSRFGPESKIIGQIFGQKEGINIYKGDMGVYVIKINKFDMPTIDVANSGDEQGNMFAWQSEMMYQRRVFDQSSKALKKMYKIEDNRYKRF